MFRDFSDTILSLEGGYQSNPNDKGNYVDGILIGTKYGISAPVLKAYLDRPITDQDMINLKKSTALDIYKRNYFLPGNYELYDNTSVAKLIFDTHVNHGSSAKDRIVGNALNKLTGKQRFLDIKSPESIDIINSLDQKRFHSEVKKIRTEIYENGNPVFVEGWLNRLEEFVYQPETTTVKEVVKLTIIPNIEYPGSTITLASGLFFIFALSKYLLNKK